MLRYGLYLFYTNNLPMKKTFTFDDLIRYAYNETSLAESVEIRQAIDEDTSLCEEYVRLIDTLLQMDTLLIDPPQASVDKILEYSKSRVPTHH